MMDKKYKYFIVILLIVFTLIAFGRIIGNDFINYDDDKYITENNHIKEGINSETIKWAFTTTYFSYWHPLTWLSYMLDWSLFGANASGHHLVSLLWHIGSAILLFLFLSKTTRSIWPSAFVAALFALHPLRVESVAWIAERKDVLSMFFGMATLYAYAYYVEKLQISQYFICLILFVLGLMSKPMLVTLPFVLLLLDYWPLGRWPKVLNPEQNDKTQVAISKPQKKKSEKKKADVIGGKKISVPAKSSCQIASSLLWEKAPFILLSMILSISLILQQKTVGGMATLEEINFSTRVINTIVFYVFYLGKIFWPVDLAVFYPYQYYFPLWQVVGSLLVLLGVSLASFLLSKKTPFLLVGWLWYLGTLFPVIGLLQAGTQAMADRYTYLPSIGITIMLIWGIVYILPGGKLRKIILIPAAVIALTVLTFLTWQQCGYWKNTTTLFSHALQVTKNNYLAHANLGVTLNTEGKNEQALTHYLSALKINPHFADAHYNLANLLKEQGKMEESLKHFRETLLINSNFPNAHNNIGIILEKYFNKYDEAIDHYEQELRINNNPGTHFNLGIVLAKKGRLKAAEGHFRQAIYLKPDYEEARRALRLALDIQQRQKR